MNSFRSDVSVPASVIDYPARDMTITVGAAMTTGELDAILGKENQQLPVDAPDPTISLGDLVAHDIAGPRQYGYGTLRDYVIGLEAVDGKGRCFHSGGRVVKNVAGYDLCRLLVGSNHRFGTLTHLTFKVRPRPASQSLLVAGFRNLKNVEDALNALNTSATTPVILDLLNRSAAQALLHSPIPELAPDSDRMDSAAFLVVGFDGPQNACQWQNTTLTRELSDYAAWVHPAQLPNASDLWCRTAQSATLPHDSVAWLAAISTRPSRVVAVTNVMHQAGCDVFGRAGNGVLICRPSSAPDMPNPPDESHAIGLLHSLTSQDDGSVNVIKAVAMRSSIPPDAVTSLASKLQMALGN